MRTIESKIKSIIKPLVKPLKVVLAITFLPFFFSLTMVSLDHEGYFDIKSIEVRVEEPVEQFNFLKPELEKLQSKLDKFRNQSLWSLRLKEVSNQMDENLWIENSRISRSWPSTLALTIKPYKIKLLLLNPSGNLQPVIRDGDILQPIETSMAPDVIVLQGEQFQKDKQLRKRAVDLVSELPSGGTYSKDSISEITFDEKDGFWTKMMKSGLNVRLGEGQYALKAKRVSQVLDYLQKHELDAKMVDANLSKKVLVRMHH